MTVIPHITLKSAQSRLMVTYLSIIMAFSIGFSVLFYYQSINAAHYGLNKQLTQLQDNLYFTTRDGLERITRGEITRFRDNLLARLVLFNAGMLAVGSAASFVLARRSLRPLEDAMLAQGRFTSDAAHELRTPLTAMKTEIEVSLRDKKLRASEARQVLASNLEEIEKLEVLTAALLRLARSDEKGSNLLWQDYSLSDILHAAIERVKEEAKRRNITIRVPSTKLIVCGDSDQLVELFVILLSNAIKYSHDNSEVKITASVRDKKLRVSVTDKGVGITELDLPHIFERFYRADQSRTGSGAHGYGLGLSLADAIVKVHGGKIEVKSTHRQGSTFTVVLPV